jgi:hypothetical protein
MLGLRWRIESTQRMKNGQPAHSTTGVAMASSSHDIVAGASGMKRCPPIAMTTPTALSGSVDQNRRVKFSSSGFLSSSSVGISGSSAIPQIGQFPGAGRRICGCIGHVYMVIGLLSSCPAPAERAPGRSGTALASFSFT